MAVGNVLRLTIRGLLARRARTALTMLGIMIGVAGVITIMSLGAGAQSLILGQVTKLGSNLLSIQPGKSTENGPPVQAFGVVITTLTNQDVDALRNQARLPHVMAVNPGVQGNVTVTWGSRSLDSSFLGTDATYPQVVNFSMQRGRFFDQQQEQGGANVVVLGSSVSEELFGRSGVDPVGQIIRVKDSQQSEAGGTPLRVIGVIAPRGSSFFQNQDALLFLPLQIGQERILGIRHLQVITVKVRDASSVDQSIGDITAVLRQTHRIQPGEEDDFTVRNQADAINILSMITNAMSLFLTAMAAISLIVGGIGILNIMLVTVAERTREI
ncbi:ABC transporter permease, partial [Candidatus Uhrbacteria bacterium]|nr:ABC transporter permease [Candidatus Uhrbacteria bacterium]